MKSLCRVGVISVLLVVGLHSRAAAYTSQFETLPGWVTALPYHISGGTRQELRRAIREARADLEGDTANGDFGAVVISSYSYEIESEPTTPSRSSSGAWACTSGDSVDVRLSVAIRYPIWDDLRACPDSVLLSEWQHYMTALYHHEIGHVYIARAGLRRIKRELTGLEMTASAGSGTAACDLACRLYRQLIKEDFERITAEILQAQQEYDSRTDYGRKQGAGF